MSNTSPEVDEFSEMLYKQLRRAQNKLMEDTKRIRESKLEWEQRAMKDEYLRARYTVETYEIRCEIAQIKRLEQDQLASSSVIPNHIITGDFVVSERETYVVTLPISGVEADMAGMPAEWLERAIRAVGRPQVMRVTLEHIYIPKLTAS